MARDLVCRKCAAKRAGLHPQGVEMGWKERTVWLAITTPADVMPDRIPAEQTEFHCDKCGENINNQLVLAVTRYLGEQRRIGPWEQDFGRIIPDEAVAMADKLEKE